MSSQLDADRADYLLRDSHHCGVTYGHYDLNRLLVTMKIGMTDTDSPILAIEDGGIHVAEALIIARYQMFTQVYFQHTRRAFDHHIAEILKVLLIHVQTNDTEITNKDKFPPPISEENLKRYIAWDDWKVLGLVSSGVAEEVGEILLERKHHRVVYQTSEVPNPEQLDLFDIIKKDLLKREIPFFTDSATSSWYKVGKDDISICFEDSKTRKIEPLSKLSSIVKGLLPIMQQRVYVPLEYKVDAKKIIGKLKGE